MLLGKKRMLKNTSTKLVPTRLRSHSTLMTDASPEAAYLQMKNFLLQVAGAESAKSGGSLIAKYAQSSEATQIE